MWWWCTGSGSGGAIIIGIDVGIIDIGSGGGRQVETGLLDIANDSRCGRCASGGCMSVCVCSIGASSSSSSCCSCSCAELLPRRRCPSLPPGDVLDGREVVQVTITITIISSGSIGGSTVRISILEVVLVMLLMMVVVVVVLLVSCCRGCAAAAAGGVCVHTLVGAEEEERQTMMMSGGSAWGETEEEV